MLCSVCAFFFVDWLCLPICKYTKNNSVCTFLYVWWSWLMAFSTFNSESSNQNNIIICITRMESVLSFAYEPVSFGYSLKVLFTAFIDCVCVCSLLMDIFEQSSASYLNEGKLFSSKQISFNEWMINVHPA